ncbi:MAG TPA: Hsp20/alpha crystallin family protein [Geobacteraceae bacterium]|jgi:HSP20 family protein|nr:Hsp20/alpha crystallin family protein [Geobacteraceae bacterium]
MSRYGEDVTRSVSGSLRSLAGGNMAVIPKDLPEFVNEFQQRLDELFDRLFKLEKKGLPGEQDVTPAVDCFETADEYMVEIELPGFYREDLTLGVIRNVLVLEGVKREEEKADTVNYICLERTFGRFCRTVEIPPMVDISGVKARYIKGILYVTFPKVSEAGAKIKEIPIE